MDRGFSVLTEGFLLGSDSRICQLGSLLCNPLAAFAQWALGVKQRVLGRLMRC